MKIALGVRNMLRQAIFFARSADPGHRRPRLFYLHPDAIQDLHRELTPSEFNRFAYSDVPGRRSFCGVPIVSSCGTPRMVTALNEIQEL